MTSYATTKNTMCREAFEGLKKDAKEAGMSDDLFHNIIVRARAEHHEGSIAASTYVRREINLYKLKRHMR